jgi:hypothetical protein
MPTDAMLVKAARLERQDSSGLCLNHDNFEDTLSLKLLAQ